MLGEGRPDAARLAALTATLLTLVASGGIVTAVVLSRQQLGHVFSTDAAVIALGASVLPILGAALLGDGANGVLAGAVAGQHCTLSVSSSAARRNFMLCRDNLYIPATESQQDAGDTLHDRDDVVLSFCRRSQGRGSADDRGDHELHQLLGVGSAAGSAAGLPLSPGHPRPVDRPAGGSLSTPHRASPAAAWGTALSTCLVLRKGVFLACWRQCGALQACAADSHDIVMLLQVATSVQALGLGGIVACFDWAAEARKAATRVAASKVAAVQDEEEASGLLGGGDRH